MGKKAGETNRLVSPSCTDRVPREKGDGKRPHFSSTPMTTLLGRGLRGLISTALLLSERGTRAWKC